MSGKWVVLLEATSTSSSGEVDQPTLSRLLREVEDAEPVALHGVDRYAVQLKVTAENPVDALSSALSRWTEAVRSVGAATWEVVRAEVMTKAELEQELRPAPATGNVHEAPFKLATGAGELPLEGHVHSSKEQSVFTKFWPKTRGSWHPASPPMRLVAT